MPPIQNGAKAASRYFTVSPARISFSLIIPNAPTQGPPTSRAVQVNLGNLPGGVRCLRLMRKLVTSVKFPANRVRSATAFGSALDRTAIPNRSSAITKWGFRCRSPLRRRCGYIEAYRISSHFNSRGRTLQFGNALEAGLGRESADAATPKIPKAKNVE